MELINDNLQQPLTSLRDKGLFTLVSHIENTSKINQEEYEDGSVYDTDKGYGVRIYIMHYVQEYIEKIKEFNLLPNDVKIEKTIIEENKMYPYVKQICEKAITYTEDFHIRY